MARKKVRVTQRFHNLPDNWQRAKRIMSLTSFEPLEGELFDDVEIRVSPEATIGYVNGLWILVDPTEKKVTFGLVYTEDWPLTENPGEYGEWHKSFAM